MPRRAKKRRSRAPMIIAVVSVLLGLGMMAPFAYSKFMGNKANGSSGDSALPSPSPSPPPPPPTLKADETTVIETPANLSYFSWALLDRESGEIHGSDNMATGYNTTESMIKAWLVSDFLRLKGDKQPTAAELKWTSTAIRDSNDDSASALWSRIGKTASVARMNKICGTAAKNWTKAPYAGWWSFTQITAQDIAKLGDCIGSGKAAGPTWTDYVLKEMRSVRGTVTQNTPTGSTGGGHWGIIDGVPDNELADTSIKNGWEMHYADMKWHINCLAITDKWTLGVSMQFPTSKFKNNWLNGLKYGASVCQKITAQLVYPQPEPEPSSSASASANPSTQP